MNIEKNCKSLALATSLAFGILAGLLPAQDAHAADTFVIRVGHTNPPDQAPGVELRKFKEIIEQKAGGRIEVKIYDSGTLGKGKELLEGLQLDTVEMALLISEPPALHPKLAVVELPWLFKSAEHEKRVMNGPVGKEIAGLIEQKNLKVLGLWFNGFREVCNNKRPINTPADMDGLKIRVGSNPIRTRMFETLGSNPTPIAFKEVYVALKQGVIDGAESGIDSFSTMRFNEVCTNLAMLNYNATPAFLIASGDFWKRVPDDLKSVIADSAQEMSDWTYDELGPQLEKQRIEELSKTMKVSYPDITPFRATAQPIYDDFVKEYGTEWVEMIKQAE